MAQGSAQTPLLGAVCASLGLSGGDARLLARLIERPGLLQSAESLYRVVAAQDPGDLRTEASKRVRTQLCNVRRALRKAGYPEPTGAHGLGWCYSAAAAAEVRARLALR